MKETSLDDFGAGRLRGCETVKVPLGDDSSGGCSLNSGDDRQGPEELKNEECSKPPRVCGEDEGFGG